MTSDYDVVIIGGGMVGLLLGKLLVSTDLRIAVIDSQAPDATITADSLLRVSAINRASQHLLAHCGCWNQSILDYACAYDSMHVWDNDAGGEIHFHAKALGEPDIGHIIPNAVIRHTLWHSLEQHSQVDLIAPLSLKSARWEHEHVEILTSENHTLTARLAVAADGANSWLRQQSPLHLDKFNYDHHAIVANVSCELPHQQCARQNFLATGPLALLPLSDQHACSIVWSTDPATAEQLMHLDTVQFSTQLQDHFGSSLGQLTVTSERHSYPLVSRHVSRYISDGLALVGDAAHTIHPLAGQGVNLGFLDAASLAQVMQQRLNNSQPYYLARMLRPYERWRRSENQLMLDTMLAIKTIFSKQPSPLNSIRSLGMNIMDKSPFIKQQMIRHAMGLSGDIPELAKAPLPEI